MNDKMWRIEFPKYPGGGTSTFAPDEQTALRYVKDDVVRRLGLWPKEVEVRYVRRVGT